MQQVTRTMTEFEIRAYDLGENEKGEMEVQEIAACKVVATSMTKGQARKVLKQVIKGDLARGLTIKWEAVKTTTYAMPLDEFLAAAIETKIETIKG